MTGRRVKVFFDGGCRPNPGPIEAAVVVRGAVHVFEDLGNGDNADAEWLALICAMDVAKANGLTGVELIGDALVIVQQADAVLRSGAATPGHPARFLQLCADVRPARVRWIKRAQNLAGVALARRHPR